MQNRKVILGVLVLFLFMIGNSFAEDKAIEAVDKIFQAKLAKYKKLVDNIEFLKEQNDSSWKGMIQAFVYKPLLVLVMEEPASAEVHLLLARCYFYNNRIRQAKAELERALLFSPDSSDALIFKGDMQAKGAFDLENDFPNPVSPHIVTNSKKAVEAYEIALAASISDKDRMSSIYYKMAKLYKEDSNKGKAIEYWERAVSTAPNSHWAKLAESKLKEVKK